MTASLAQPRFRIKGWHVLVSVTAFFLVVVAVDVGFLVMAYRTFPGEVSRTPYEDGVTYNRKLAQLQAQAKLGWTVSAGVLPSGEVLARVRDRDGRPVTGLTGSGKLERPATEAGRITPAFRETAPGEYLARPGRLLGSWDLTLVLTDKAGRRFEAERRLTWP